MMVVLPINFASEVVSPSFSPQIGLVVVGRLQPNVAVITTILETVPGPLRGLDLCAVSSPCCNKVTFIFRRPFFG